ncbi:MAG: 1,2-phenylacetyl-CoA epoxidase subunit PaaC [Longimicrobiaceae bacterium]
MSGATAQAIQQAAELAPSVRTALRDLILALADGKRLLGIRYSDWMLGAPSLEAGIAASSMAQDEWGHARLTYALLSDFGDDTAALEREREAADYRNPEPLDRRFSSWAEMTAAGLILDTAFAVQYAALAGSRYEPLHNRVQKLLDEEAFHYRHAAGWARRLASSPEPRKEFAGHARRLLPAALRWFGSGGSETARALVEQGIADAAPDQLRERLLERVAPVLLEPGLAGLALSGQPGSWRYEGEIDWDGWDDTTRRANQGGPDAGTLARVRGDLNRAFLVE